MDNQIKQPNSHLSSPDSAIILYTTGCPLCHVLEAKLQAKKIAYQTCSDTDKMRSLGITHVPILSINGELLQMKDAMEYIERKATTV